MSSTHSDSLNVGAGASAIEPPLRGEEGLADTSNKSPAPATSFGTREAMKCEQGSVALVVLVVVLGSVVAYLLTILLGLVIAKWL